MEVLNVGVKKLDLGKLLTKIFPHYGKLSVCPCLNSSWYIHIEQRNNFKEYYIASVHIYIYIWLFLSLYGIQIMQPAFEAIRIACHIKECGQYAIYIT